MLPGFRFLFAAIVLSMSAMVFGLGAASLFRAAHEKFASMPSRQGPPVTVFALQNDTAPPALAMLRVEAPAVEKPADNVVQPALATERPATVSTPAEPEISAALKPADSPAPSEIAKPEMAKSEMAKSEFSKSEIPIAETPPHDEAAPAPANAPAPADQTKIAATEPAALPLANQAAPAASQPALSEPVVSAPAVASEPALPQAASAPTTIDTKVATKIATLGGPPVAIETKPPAKADDDESTIKKHQRAQRATHRRQMAARARLAQQTPQPFQQPADGFSQPSITVRKR